MSAAPLFVIGVARSGTNLLARMLGRHPGVSMALDPLMPLFKALRNAVITAEAPAPIAGRFDGRSPFQDYYFAADGPALLDTLLSGSMTHEVRGSERDLLVSRIRDRAALESADLARRLAALDGVTYDALLTSTLTLVAAERPLATWAGLKEVWVIEFVPMLARAFPDARFYAVERDPRAIIASLLEMARTDPTQAAHVPSYLRHWRKGVALTRRFEVDPALAKRFRVVSYERLSRDPEPEARRICAELGLEYDARMLSLSADGWCGNSSFGRRQDIYSDTAQRWRTALDSAAVAAVEFLCGPEMALTDYEPTTRRALDRDVFACLERASLEPGSWRSDSGDALIDLGGELLRHEIVGGSIAPGEQLVRRCFLFQATIDQIRRAAEPAVLAAGGQRE